MKLASYKSGRDGRLMIVSRDLQRCCSAEGIADTLQQALDDWARVAGMLEERSDALNSGTYAQSEEFDTARCAAPSIPWPT